MCSKLLSFLVTERGRGQEQNGRVSEEEVFGTRFVSNVASTCTDDSFYRIHKEEREIWGREAIELFTKNRRFRKSWKHKSRDRFICFGARLERFRFSAKSSPVRDSKKQSRN